MRGHRLIMVSSCFVLTLGSAPAVAEPAPHDSSPSVQQTAVSRSAAKLSARLTHGRVRYDATAVAAGTLSQGGHVIAHAKVVVKRTLAGATRARKVGATTTTRTGHFKVRLPHQRSNAVFVVSSARPRARSKTLRLTVTAPLTGVAMAPSGADATYGQTRTWTASTVATLAGVAVRLQRDTGSGWSNVEVGSVGSDGSISVAHDLSTPGQAGYRLALASSTRLSGANGPRMVVTTAGVPTVLTITTSSLPSATQNAAYDQTLNAAAGTGPYTWSVVAGTLPDGVVLGAAGNLHGVPTQTGTFPFTAQVDDGTHTATKQLSLTVGAGAAPLSVTTPGISDGEVGIAFYTGLSASPDNGSLTWTKSAGTIPAGLALEGFGALDGTPTSAGTFTFTAQVDDGTSTAGHQYTVRIEPAGTSPLQVTTSSVPLGTPGTAYALWLTSNAAVPVTWTKVAGSLPPGLSLTSAGLLHGTPTTVGDTLFTVAVTDGTRHAYADVEVFVQPGSGTSIAIQPASVPDATNGVPYSQQLGAEGAQGALTFSVSGGSLPAGMTLSADGLLSGVPTSVGSSTFTVFAGDAAGATDSREYTLHVTSSPTPILVSTVLPGGQVGNGYAYRPHVAGGSTPYIWGITAGSLPAGLSLNTSTGLIHGVPTTTGTSTVTVAVTDSAAHTASKVLSLAVVTATSSTGPGVDGSRRGFNANEQTVTPADVFDTGVEWRTDADVTAIAGGHLLQCHSELGAWSFRVLDLQSGALLWSKPLTNSCGRIETSGTTAYLAVADRVLALDLGTHATLWDTSVTDPGSSVNDLVVTSQYVVAGGGSRIAAYAFADGALLWQRNLTQPLSELFADATHVYTIDQAQQLTSRNLDPTGSQAWTVATVTEYWGLALPGRGEIVTQGGANNDTLLWRSAANGSVLRTWTSPVTWWSTIAADAQHVYATTAAFNESGGFSDTRLEAVNHDGTLAWTANTPTLMNGGVTVGGSGSQALVWDTLSGRFKDGGPTTVEARLPGTGAVLYSHDLDSTSSFDPVVGGGRLFVPTNAGAYVMGVMAPSPSADEGYRPGGFVGKAYTTALTGTGGQAPYTWARTAGALPPGLSLGSGGTVSGTPTTPGTYQFTATLTDTVGLSSAILVRIAIRTGQAYTWSTTGRSGGRDAAVLTDPTIDLDSLATFGTRWGGAGAYASGPNQAAFSATRAYLVRSDTGHLMSYDVTQSGTGHAALWSVAPDTGSTHFVGTPTLVGTGGSAVLYVMTDAGSVAAVDPATGAVVWTSPSVLGPSPDGVGTLDASPVVSGGRVLFSTGQHVAAVDTSTHAVLWTKDDTIEDALSTDGTRVFYYHGCHVIARSVATGDVVWDVNESPDTSCYPTFGDANGLAPVAADGLVYAASYWYGVFALDPATGSVTWHRSFQAGTPGVAVSENYLVTGNVTGDALVVLDAHTGALVESLSGSFNANPTLVGDLVLAGSSDQKIHAYDLATRTDVWSSSAIPFGPSLRPMVSAGRVYAMDFSDAMFAFGPP
jgi:hypothetical protein